MKTEPGAGSQGCRLQKLEKARDGLSPEAPGRHAARLTRGFCPHNPGTAKLCCFIFYLFPSWLPCSIWSSQAKDQIRAAAAAAATTDLQRTVTEPLSQHSQDATDSIAPQRELPSCAVFCCCLVGWWLLKLHPRHRESHRLGASTGASPLGKFSLRGHTTHDLWWHLLHSAPCLPGSPQEEHVSERHSSSRRVIFLGRLDHTWSLT